MLERQNTYLSQWTKPGHGPILPHCCVNVTGCCIFSMWVWDVAVCKCHILWVSWKILLLEPILMLHANHCYSFHHDICASRLLWQSKKTDSERLKNNCTHACISEIWLEMNASETWWNHMQWRQFSYFTSNTKYNIHRLFRIIVTVFKPKGTN